MSNRFGCKCANDEVLNDIYISLLILFPMANILRVFGGIDLLRLLYNAESIVGFTIAAVCETDWMSVVNIGEK